MGKKGKAPMSKYREMEPFYTNTTCNRAAGSQNSVEPSITDLSYTAVVKWVLNNVDDRKGQYKTQVKSLQNHYPQKV